MTSSIRSIDRQTGIATTRSGNRYELVGPPSRDFEPSWVLEYWLWQNSTTVVADDCDVNVLSHLPDD